ncbi:hypothetical protein MiSe_10000 [Microseira wollei NIES-4236]|uniref:DUF2993 domain-containing protein n=2 Tax=Microseira wollei TaxID=467598 RepID=A0AAV3XA94_9CYAN|nr:hypothetical protein MiSe_10000 [Microseira wollei NIES-4236]
MGKALSTAVALWLRSQLEGVEDLQVQIDTSSRLVFAGLIPKVAVSAREAIYQGLYLRQISLIAKDIQVNVRQILKGQPLRLNEPIPVTGELLLQESDLNNSLTSPLLANGLTEFLVTLVQGAGGQGILKGQQISWRQINLAPCEIIINGVCFDFSGQETPVSIRAKVRVENGHKLQLNSLQIELLSLPPIDLDSFELDLGSEVEIQELTLNPGELICRGGILVNP